MFVERLLRGLVELYPFSAVRIWGDSNKSMKALPVIPGFRIDNSASSGKADPQKKNVENIVIKLVIMCVKRDHLNLV